jgi:hypothetical protein
MLPFENAKLLPKSKVFDEQVAARAKEASGHDRQKPQQEHHETSFARVHAKAGTQPTYLIRQQIAILASHNAQLRAITKSSSQRKQAVEMTAHRHDDNGDEYLQSPAG